MFLATRQKGKMMLRTSVLVALCASAAAYVPAGQMGLRMTAGTTRRDVNIAGAVGAGAAIFGVVEPANAQLRSGSKRPTPKRVGSDRMPAKNFAPVITILDHRGCARSGAEYKGEKSGDQDDEMCVVIKQTQLNVASPAFKDLASTVLASSLSTLSPKDTLSNIRPNR